RVPRRENRPGHRPLRGSARNGASAARAADDRGRGKCREAHCLRGMTVRYRGLPYESGLLSTRRPVIPRSIRNALIWLITPKSKGKTKIRGSEGWTRSDLPLMWRARGRVVCVAFGKLCRLLPFILGKVG